MIKGILIGIMLTVMTLMVADYVMFKHATSLVIIEMAKEIDGLKRNLE